MANWIASRCDNSSETLIIDTEDAVVTTGSTVSVGGKQGSLCYTLVEQTLNKANTSIGDVFDSCLECLIKAEVMLAFKPCFSGDELIIPSNLLNFVPQIDTVYKLNLTITIEGKRSEIININGCYTYSGYIDAKPVGDIKFNSESIEYNTCEECNPYVSNKKKWDEMVSSKFEGARDSYLNNFR
jgi:hypothetical protein